MNKLNADKISATLLAATVGITAVNVYLLAIKVRGMEKSVTSMGSVLARMMAEPV